MDGSTFNDFRERIGKTVTLRLNDAYIQGVVSEEEAAVISTFILDNIDKPNNQGELMTFLEELANKWPLFGPLLVAEHTQTIQQNEEEAVNQVSELLKENKIDEAIATAGHANQNSQENSSSPIQQPSPEQPSPEQPSPEQPSPATEEPQVDTIATPSEENNQNGMGGSQ